MFFEISCAILLCTTSGLSVFAVLQNKMLKALAGRAETLAKALTNGKSTTYVGPNVINVGDYQVKFFHGDPIAVVKGKLAYSLKGSDIKPDMDQSQLKIKIDEVLKANNV